MRWAATGCISFIHVFLRLVPGCWFHRIYTIYIYIILYYIILYYIILYYIIYIYIYISEPSLVYLPVGIFATKGMFRTWCLYPNYFFTTYIWQNLARHGRFAHTATYKLYCLIWLSCIKVDQTEWPWCWTQWYVYFLFPSAFYTWNWVLDGCGGKLCVWSSDPSAIRCRGFKWGYE